MKLVKASKNQSRHGRKLNCGTVKKSVASWIKKVESAYNEQNAQFGLVNHAAIEKLVKSWSKISHGINKN